MDKKIRTAVISVLTVLVCANAGYNLYHIQKDSSNTPKKMFGHNNLLVIEPEQNIKFVGQNEKLSKELSFIDKIISSRFNKSKSHTTSSNYGWYKEENTANRWNMNSVWGTNVEQSNSEYGFKGQHTAANSNISDISQQYKVYTLSEEFSTFTGGLAYNTKITSRRSSPDNTRNNSENNLTLSSPMAVPFSNGFTGQPSTSDGIILFDPGAEIDTPIVPVGESGWILLIMAGMYGIIRKKRIRS